MTCAHRGLLPRRLPAPDRPARRRRAPRRRARRAGRAELRPRALPAPTRATGSRRGSTATRPAARAATASSARKPGTYGAGILPLIDERNWQTDADFAEAYVNWGGYAYTADEYGVDARAEFETRPRPGRRWRPRTRTTASTTSSTSDDYLQFHGGMIATIRALTGTAPRRYFGDTRRPGAAARARPEGGGAARVPHARGQPEVDRLASSATATRARSSWPRRSTTCSATTRPPRCVDDWMYERGDAQPTSLDPAMQEFFERSNPWALRDISRAAAGSRSIAACGRSRPGSARRARSRPT